jgi:hypothetical protein
MDNKLVKRLLDVGDTMMDPDQRRFLHGTILMELMAEATEARDEYLATYAMLRERGIRAKPDTAILTSMNTVIAQLAEDATALFEGKE